ncbi:MAG: hemolysin family protein [Bacteroidales bacterium]|nr:hemolysin family protein [Bacteroidales bacterium]MDZ4203247.1 hemolysin family protein [Bacteroidales bacterium]
MDSYTLILIMILGSAFFSGIEIAFITSNKLKIELEKSKGTTTGRLLARFIKSPSHLIAALLVGNNLALVIYGMAMTHRLEPWLSNRLPSFLNNEFSIFLLQTILSTLLILIFAEFLPKMLFRINPNAVLNVFALPIHFFYLLFFPVILVFTKLSEFILKYILRINIIDQHYQFSPVDLDNYMKELDSEQLRQSEEKQEIQMFQNAMDFHLIKLRECMIPRTEIVAIDQNDTVAELAGLMSEKGLSRIPVYSESIDNIIGYAHVFDLYKRPTDLKSIIKPIIIAPETMTANKILTTFIQQHKTIALVVDEFGGTSGIVTMEDVIEEIFGEIDDEYDRDQNIEIQLSDTEFIFSGRLEIDYLNETYQFNLPKSDDYETLAGMIMYYHESIPDENEEILVAKYSFVIELATETRIEQVRLSVLADK